MGGVIRMKFRIYGMVLGAVFRAGARFSFGMEASADGHDGDRYEHNCG